MAALDAMRERADSTADLAGIDVPVLVLAGEEDVLTPPEGARAMAEAIPGSELVVVPGAGHLAPLEKPAAVSRALRNLILRCVPC
jgi:pimeloyl-ACP methyl ester carboxylesterase